MSVEVICERRENHAYFLKQPRLPRLVGEDRQLVGSQAVSKSIDEIIDENQSLNQENNKKANCKS